MWVTADTPSVPPENHLTHQNKFSDPPPPSLGNKLWLVPNYVNELYSVRLPTFLQGLELISKADLNIFLCWLVSIVRGLFGPFLSSFSSSPITEESSESELSAFSNFVSLSFLKLLLITSAEQIDRQIMG